MPLMVGDWNMGGTGIYSPRPANTAALARPELGHDPDARPARGVIPTDGLPMQDDRHLNMAGHKVWAERALHDSDPEGLDPVGDALAALRRRPDFRRCQAS